MAQASGGSDPLARGRRERRWARAQARVLDPVPATADGRALTLAGHPKGTMRAVEGQRDQARHHAQEHDGAERLQRCPRRSSRRSLYSTESTRACQEASMMLSATPTVPHVSSPSPEVMSTRVFAAVALASSRMRTL